MLNLGSLISLTLVLFSGFALAQITLPAPSRTVFKGECEVAGKEVYSDSPCLSAQKIDVEPTRGLNNSTGRELVGSDVRQEQQRELMATAIQPITGMDAKQFGDLWSPHEANTWSSKECKQLDIKIPIAEQEEKVSKPEALAQSQATLLGLRKHFREIKC